MKFVNELYEYYKDRLTGDEEDAEVIAMSILQELKRRDLLRLIDEMADEELAGMIALYIIEGLKAKMAQEGFTQTNKPSIHELH